MDRFADIKKNTLALAERSEDIRAVIIIGSQTRSVVPADRYSDLDMILVTYCPELYLSGDDRISSIGKIKISFVEPTVGGGLERRMLLEGSLDVDLIVLTPEQFYAMAKEHIAAGILSRGWETLYDSMDISHILERNISPEHSRRSMSERDFFNISNDFWYHTVWAAKKICRGELWTAKMCVDAYLKNLLLSMIELYHISRHGAEFDVWHNGRLMENWADEYITSALTECFGHYQREGIVSALMHTADLFGRLAIYSAKKNGFTYPSEAEQYAREQLKELLG